MFTLSIARANPDELISETIHSAAELEPSTNTWIKYSKLIIFTAKLPKIPAV